MISVDFGRSLFAKEFEVLETALAQVAAGRYEGNSLASDYEELLDHYHRLLTLTRKVFKISDTQSSILAQREGEFRHLLDHVGQGIFTFGPNLVVNREYSSECLCIFGRKIGKLHVMDLLTSDDEGYNRCFVDGFTRLWSAADLEQRQACLDALPRMICRQGKHLALDFKLISRDSQDMLVMVIATDVTEKRQAEEKIAYLSYRDKLTALYNRAYVEAALPSLQLPECFPVSVIMADMNGLKLTNDVFGHAQGDRLLVGLGQVLMNCLRPQDIVARWGGDEFVVILPATSARDCQAVSERIEQACARAEGFPIELSVALGWATQQH
ncbi:MAG: diguanylate cyclase domain-containing protein, partial [Bacillota bacterium]